MEDMQPGQVVQPNGPNPPTPPAAGAPQPTRSPEQVEPPVPVPAPPAEPAAAPAPASLYTATPPPPAQPEPADWYRPADADEVSPATHHPLPDELSWTAAEFIAHDKDANWFLGLGAGGLVLTILIYVLTKDKITTGIVIFTAIAFGIFAARKPREQSYALTQSGLQIGSKLYGFHDFKSFSATEETGVTSIIFMPLKRFMPPLTIYLPQNIEKQIVDFLADFLPVEQHRADAVDSLLRRIHF